MTVVGSTLADSMRTSKTPFLILKFVTSGGHVDLGFRLRPDPDAGIGAV